MAAATRDYDANEIILGPSDVWLDVAVPTAGNRLTLDTGTPETVANPNAFHLGMTESGVVISYKPEIQKFGSDELTAFHLVRIVAESLMIKGTFLQVFDWDLLAKMSVGGTLGSHTHTSTGYEELTFGGKSTVSTFSVAVIGPDIADSTKYWVFQLYKTYNQAGFEIPITRRDQSKAPFEFEGLAVTTRATNDQIGNLWRQGPPPATP